LVTSANTPIARSRIDEAGECEHHLAQARPELALRAQHAVGRRAAK